MCDTHTFRDFERTPHVCYSSNADQRSARGNFGRSECDGGAPGHLGWRPSKNGRLTTAVQFYDQVSQIVCDSAGNSYAIGQFSNTVDLGNGVPLTDTNTNQQTVNPPNWPATIGTKGFVAKYDPNGNVLWARDTATMTGGNHFAAQVAVTGSTVYVLSGAFDNNGNGYTNSWTQLTVTALNATSGAVIWSHHTLGGGSEQMAADANGAYLTSSSTTPMAVPRSPVGPTWSISTPTTPGLPAPCRSLGRGPRASSLRFGSDGTFQWAKEFGMPADGLTATGIVSDGQTVYVAGTFSTSVTYNGQTLLTNVDITPGSPSSDAFVLKLNPDGSVVTHADGTPDV